MKVKELEQWLSGLKGFPSPKIQYEQYATDAHLASRMLHVAQTTFGDIEGKLVLDLGCGCGALSIGAMLLGSGANVGVDIDADALEVFKKNLEETFDDVEAPPFDLIHANVLAQKAYLRPDLRFDTVLLNPPFGTKFQANADTLFLQQAMALTRPGGAVYSMHKSSTRDHVLRKAREWGAKESVVVAQLRFDLPATYKFHKKEKVIIDVDLLRFQI